MEQKTRQLVRPTRPAQVKRAANQQKMMRPQKTASQRAASRPNIPSGKPNGQSNLSASRRGGQVSGEPTARRTLKVPEAIPGERIKETALDKIKSAVFRKKATIQSIVREPTSGGIVFRFTRDKKDIEILLIQDSKERWTIPKGHIEPGETAKMTARREIEEETGLKNISILGWLGKINFKYRRLDKLVLMTTQVYLVQALDSHETPTPEKWMKGIKWFSFSDALDVIEYEDIGKLILISKRKIRAGDY